MGSKERSVLREGLLEFLVILMLCYLITMPPLTSGMGSENCNQDAGRVSSYSVSGEEELPLLESSTPEAEQRVALDSPWNKVVVVGGDTVWGIVNREADREGKDNEDNIAVAVVKRLSGECIVTDRKKVGRGLPKRVRSVVPGDEVYMTSCKKEDCAEEEKMLEQNICNKKDN